MTIRGCAGLFALLAATGVAGAAGVRDRQRDAASAVEETRRIVTEARAVPSFALDAPAFDARAAMGKSVVYVTGNLEAPDAAIRAATFKQVLGRFGVRVIVEDLGAATRADLIRAAKTISRSRGALLLLVGSTVQHNSFLGAAKRDDPALFLQFLTMSDRSRRGVLKSAQGGINLDAVARVIAARAMLAAGDSINVTTAFVLDESVERRWLAPAVDEAIASLSSAPHGTMSIELPGLDRMAPLNALLDRPNESAVKALVTLGAPLTELVAGRSASASFDLVGYPATRVAMRELARPNGRGALVGFSQRWFAYAMADQALRKLVGLAPLDDERVPARIFEHGSPDGVDPRADAETWYGTAYVDGYARLWSGARVNPRKTEPPGAPGPVELTQAQPDPPALPPNSPLCPPRYGLVTGGCVTRETMYLRCRYPEGDCACTGPQWCGGAARPPPPLASYAWHCIATPPRIRADGCPGRQPAIGAACQGKKVCGYSPTGCGGQTIACDRGRWQMVGVIAPPP
jgi:ribose transport system substrate-binding protein